MQYLEIIELLEPDLSYSNLRIEYLILFVFNQSNLLNDLYCINVYSGRN